MYDVIDTFIPSDIDGIAISMPGRIDSERGIAITGGALLYIKNESVEEYFSNKYHVPVWIGNDAKCAGCLIKDKQVHHGKHFTAGEVSCIYVDTPPKPDFSNSWAMGNGINGLLQCVQKHLGVKEKFCGEEIFELANQGNTQVLNALDEYCTKLAVQLYNIQTIFDPEKIAIGGGISAQPILIEKINEQYQKLFVEFLPVRPVPIVACMFQNDANLIGAYYELRKKMG